MSVKEWKKMAKLEKSKWDKYQCRKIYSCNILVARQRQWKGRSATQWRKNITRDYVKKADTFFTFLH